MPCDLIYRFCSYITWTQGIKRLKVAVSGDNKRACRLYEKAGGTLLRQIEVHRGENSNVYVFDTN